MKSMALEVYDHSYVENVALRLYNHTFLDKLFGSTALFQANIFNFILFIISEST